MTNTPNFALWISDMTPKFWLFPNFCVLWWQNFPNFSSYLVNLAGPCPKFCLQTWCEVQAPPPTSLFRSSPPGLSFKPWLELVQSKFRLSIHKIVQNCSQRLSRMLFRMQHFRVQYFVTDYFCSSVQIFRVNMIFHYKTALVLFINYQIFSIYKTNFNFS